jgi:carboxyl-terminal processing protease
MKKRFFIVVSITLLCSGFITRDNDLYFEINKGIDLFGRVYKEVALNYVDELNPEGFMLAGIDGMLGSLDPYSNFIDTDQQKDIEIITKGKYGGIGASVGMRNGEVTVVDLIEGFSAQRQGVRIGDIITKINDVKIDKNNYDNLGEYLKGDIGTTLTISVKRENNVEILLFNLVREEIVVKNLTYYGFVPENSENAYLKLSGFSHAAGDEVKKALLELKSKKEIKSVVIDLRGNPGGLLDAAIDVCEKFLKKGQLIVTVKGRDSLNVKSHYSVEEPILPDAKIAVLIDEGTASAAEIVSGALQDHDRAFLLGTNSFGKGLVQTIVSLPYNTSLKLTTARYYTPSGRSIQRINYSDKNKVFSNYSILAKKEYLTDHKRKVFSAGGISPDSLVKNEIGSELVQKLLAEGMFFKFATHVFNQNSKMNLSTFSAGGMIKEFSGYLSLQNFDFVSKTEKLIDQLKSNLTEQNIDPKIIEQLEKTKSQINANHFSEINKYKEEILNYIREELAARIAGREGRVKESLTFDKQFESALSILNEPVVYNRMMNASPK